jgi:hypothetical protein
MICRVGMFSVALLLIATPVEAQIVSNLTDPHYLAINSSTAASVSPAACNTGVDRCGSLGIGVPLNYFATASSVNALSARLDAAIGAFDPAGINTQLAAINDRISIAYEVATIAASMRDAIPNPGDRFAIRINAAAMDGYAAGSLGVGVSLTDSTRLSINYGRGRTQNVMSGGLNISFR